MENKKGFTLIEVIVVIVVLGIVMLIMIPLTLKARTDAKKEAFKNSTYGIVKSAENVHMKLKMENKLIDDLLFTYKDGEEIPNISTAKLNYGGTTPKSGTVLINRDGKISIALYSDKWCAQKEIDDSTITFNNKTKEGCKLLPPLSEKDKYTDKSGANYPVIEKGMIPIKYDGTKWIKANLDEKWYDYDNKEWANVVLINKDERENYQNAATGTEIKEVDVLAYLVWIPRYKYKLFNVDALSIDPSVIEIVFERETAPKSKGNLDGTFLTHPSFTFDDLEVEGLWIGKFETTGTSGKPSIKPGIKALMSLNISTQFKTAKNFNDKEIYGLKDKVDAHMLKNMEWGAVTYLSHSKYGKDDQIWINPSSSFITGCAGATIDATPSSGCSYEYMTKNGMQASTTGNIYGIYDMSGGAYENVMGAMYDVGNKNILLDEVSFEQSVIDEKGMEKYIDKYDYLDEQVTQKSYKRRKLGDATGEVRGWYNTNSTFVDSNMSWFKRGGAYDYSDSSGPFDLSTSSGVANSSSGFRVALIGISK